MSRNTLLALVACAGATLVWTAASDGASLKVSLGVRDNGTSAAIGADGGTSGAIEWINLDGQTLVLDDTWQQFKFTPATDPITAFTGNGVLDNATGTFEDIRFLNADAIDVPIKIYIDQVVDTVDGVAHLITGFEGYDPATTPSGSVMFRQPSFSGSTGGFLDPAPDVADVDNLTAHDGTQSYRVEWKWISPAGATQWLRLTTFNVANVPNPAISFAPGSEISFWIKGTPEPATIAVLAAGSLVLLWRRKR
jgi:hypothetical protein